VVAAGARVRYAVRAGSGAAQGIVAGTAYVSPRRKRGTAAARGAPSGLLTLHEFVQFGRVVADQPTMPGVVLDVPVAARVDAAVLPVPAVIGGASSPGSAQVVPETGAVAGVVWWGGSDE